MNGVALERKEAKFYKMQSAVSQPQGAGQSRGQNVEKFYQKIGDTSQKIPVAWVVINIQRRPSMREDRRKVLKTSLGLR